MLNEKRRILNRPETSMYARKRRLRTRRRPSPTIFISVAATVVIGLIGVAIFVVTPLLTSHAAPSHKRNYSNVIDTSIDSNSYTSGKNHTSVQRSVSGTLTATLNTTAGTAQVQSNLTFTNASSEKFTLKITDLANNKQLLRQTKTTTSSGVSTTTSTINNLGQLQTLPNTWVATISTGSNGKVIGVAQFISNGTTATATFTASTTTSTTTSTTSTTTTTVAGTLTATLNTAAGTAQVQSNLTFTNFASQQFTMTITNSATGTTLLSQTETTDANGLSAVNVTLNNLQGVTTIPATWSATITDINGNILGTAQFVSNGTTATATFTAATTMISAGTMTIA